MTCGLMIGTAFVNGECLFIACETYPLRGPSASSQVPKFLKMLNLNVLLDKVFLELAEIHSTFRCFDC